MTVRDPLALRARATPGRTALVDHATGESWRYSDLDDAVGTAAGRLAALGVRAGDHVALLLETRPAFVRVLFAAWRLGAAVAPLNARRSAPELRDQAAAVDPVLVVAGREHVSDARALPAPVATVDAPGDDAGSPSRGDGAGDSHAAGDSHPAGDGDRADDCDADVAALPATGAVQFTAHEWAPGDRALLAFTSGTTGEPRVVEHGPGSLLASAAATAFRLGVRPGDRWLCPLPMYHVGGLSVPLRTTLYGTTTVLQRTPGFDAGDTLDALAAREATGVSVVPTQLRRLLDAAGETAGSTGSVPGSLRFVLCGGAATPPALVERAVAAGVPVCPTYGTTETASGVATPAPGEAAEHPESVGRPLVFAGVTVLADGDPAPPGEVGELVVDGPVVARGYYGDPAATRDAYGEHGLHTGDLGVRDGTGRLRVLGRLDDRVVTGGENVHPARVADALRAHPGVRDAAVVGLPDPEWGERVAALVVPAADSPGGAPPAGEAPSGTGNPDADAAGTALDADALGEFLDGRLADFERPRAYAFAADLPRTASGTVDRAAVRDLLADEADDV